MKEIGLLDFSSVEWTALDSDLIAPIFGCAVMGLIDMSIVLKMNENWLENERQENGRDNESSGRAYFSTSAPGFSATKEAKVTSLVSLATSFTGLPVLPGISYSVA